MKIFISWSGEISHQVACVLRDWLPYVIQTVKPFISSGDIYKGERWNDVLAKELEDIGFGIICLTQFNIKSDWLNFEAGALSKSIDNSLLSPFLFQVSSSKLQGPISQFQSTTYEKEDLFKLLCSINNKLEPEIKLEIDVLRNTFEVWWPQLMDKLDKLKDSRGCETETGYQWLLNPGEIEDIEVHLNCSEIWVITPSPYQDLEDALVIKLVKKNIERGVRYTFILPLSELTEELAENVNRLFLMNPEQLTIKGIPYPHFQNLVVTHYVVLNPAGVEDNPLRVFLELPIKERGYWIEVDNETAFKFAERFRGMLQDTTV